MKYNVDIQLLNSGLGLVLDWDIEKDTVPINSDQSNLFGHELD